MEDAVFSIHALIFPCVKISPSSFLWGLMKTLDSIIVPPQDLKSTSFGSYPIPHSNKQSHLSCHKVKIFHWLSSSSSSYCPFNLSPQRSFVNKSQYSFLAFTPYHIAILCLVCPLYGNCCYPDCKWSDHLIQWTFFFGSYITYSVYSAWNELLLIIFKNLSSLCLPWPFWT